MTLQGKIYFIVVAAGGGTRFGGDIPKQFRLLCGKTVVRYSIDTFLKFCSDTALDGEVIVVLSEAGRRFWSENIAADYPQVRTADGGPTRAQSVANALSLAGEAGPHDIIMVHDGARPLMTADLLHRLVDSIAGGETAVVPAIAPTDSLMEKDAGGAARPVDRSHYLAVQTPQAFDARTLIESYSRQKNAIASMTDDASVVYAATGRPIAYIAGEDTNLKITRPSDLALAEYLCSL